MKTSVLKVLIYSIMLSVITISAEGQQTLKLISSDSKITIKGTSNLHDWEETVEKFSVNLSLKILNNEIRGIDYVHLTCKTGSIVSDHDIMTNKTLEALRSDKYPEIVFTMESVEKLNSVYGKASGVLSGYLTMAGTTKRINIAFEGQISNNRVAITGSKDINMNDFKIKPPTAMLGTLKTGETVVISFLLQFQAV
jgi:phosphoenolpyruvate synthase/pyruvate phosphate dikinase